MAVKKVSIALDEGVAAAAADAARTEGVSLSAWINTAAERALKVSEGLAAVGEWETAAGAITDDERAWARSVLDGELDA